MIKEKSMNTRKRRIKDIIAENIQRNDVNLSTITYSSKYDLYCISQLSSECEISIYNLVQKHINFLHKNLLNEIFESSFTKEELQTLDLPVNRELFFSLVNRKEGLRE